MGRERGIKEGVQITIIKSADRGKKKKEIEREREWCKIEKGARERVVQVKIHVQ